MLLQLLRDTLLLSLIPSVLAVNYIERKQYCVSACATALGKVTFKGSPNASQCSGLYVDSLFDCATIYCTEDEIQPGLDEQNKTCISDGTPMPSYSDWTMDITASDLQNLTRFTKTSVKSTNYTAAVVPSQSYFDLSFETTSAKYFPTYLNWVFAWSLYAFWTLILLVAIAQHAISQVRQARLASTGPASREVSKISLGNRARFTKISIWFKANILHPNLFGDRQAHWMSDAILPTRPEAIIILLYSVMNLALCFPGYHTFIGNLSIPLPKVQLARYVANRTGVLALANLPVIWLFAARNNPFLWLTGWSHATFTQMHRWAARIATLEALTHAVCYSIAYHWQEKYYSSWSKQYFWCGAVAVIAFTLLVLFALQAIRRRWYDLYLVVHIALAVIALVTTLFHVNHMDDDSFKAFIWTCIAFWSFERTLRLSRIVYASLVPNMKGIKATASCDPGTDIVRLDVTDFFETYIPPPGSFYYIYEPGTLRGYESHPFTICSWRENDERSFKAKAETATANFDEKEMRTSTVRRASENGLDDNQGKLRHSFLIRAQRGYTKRLLDNTLMSPDGVPRQLRVMLEGPYSQSIPLEHHTNILMIVGGSGITAAVSRLHSLVQKQTSSVKLVWVVRNLALVESVCRHELGKALEHHSVDIHVTGDQEESQELRKGAKLPLAVSFGRPSIEKVVERERLKCTKSLAVFSCGPTRMNADCRIAVLKLLETPGSPIAFYEEAFGW